MNLCFAEVAALVARPRQFHGHGGCAFGQEGGQVEGDVAPCPAVVARHAPFTRFVVVGVVAQGHIYGVIRCGSHVVHHEVDEVGGGAVAFDRDVELHVQVVAAEPGFRHVDGVVADAVGAVLFIPVDEGLQDGGFRQHVPDAVEADVVVHAAVEAAVVALAGKNAIVGVDAHAFLGIFRAEGNAVVDNQAAAVVTTDGVFGIAAVVDCLQVSVTQPGVAACHVVIVVVIVARGKGCCSHQ